MAQQTILLGASPNDNTGDTLRGGGTKINANFTELYTLIAGKASQTDLEAAVALLEDAVEEISDALDGKVDVADYSDPSLVAPRFDTTQTITMAQKRQLARNTGGFVTLCFDLMGPALDMDDLSGGMIFELPRFANNFIMEDAKLTTYTRDLGTSGSLLFTFALKQGATTLAGGTSVNVGAPGIAVATIVPGDQRIEDAKETTLEVTATPTEPDGGATGLTLWLRGVWED